MPDENSKTEKPLTGQKAIYDQQELAAVKQWLKRIKDDIEYFKPDFKRMRDNMEFAAGLQWAAQSTIEDERYTANFVNREVNQKVASLYARDPKAIARRRKRLCYQMWDGTVETMQAAHMAVAQAAATGQMTPQVLQAQALIKDIDQGRMWNKVVDKVCTTMEYLYQYECDTQSPDFKYQMKQLVRRVVTCGVGYVRLNFSRHGDAALTATGTDDSVSMRMKRARRIMEQIDDDKIRDEDPRVAELEQLFASVAKSKEVGDTTNIEERLDFDFPSATSIIPDRRCKSLKGFIGARHITQRYILPLEVVNAYFEKDIKAGGELITYAEDGVEKSKPQGDVHQTNDPMEKPLCCLFEVFNLDTKERFFLVDGYKYYVQEPQYVEPSINRFWPIFTLTFNDVEVEQGQKVHVFPPSDVQLIMHPQKEWNRTRQELRKHRSGNRPFYITLEGWLQNPDIDKLNEHETCEVIKFKGIPPGGTLKDAIQKFEAAAIDPTLYNTQPLEQDALMVIGSNNIQTQQPIKHVAATPAVIQEQARVSGVNSNVDDLDDLLGELARAGGEMMLREFSLETVKRIVGQGAVWPEENREDFLNEIYLDIVASSSGRPNKAVEIANIERIGPAMLQAGANPKGLIAEYVKRLDDRLDITDFFPLMPPQQGPMKPQGGQPGNTPGLVGQQPGGMGQPAPVMQGGQ